MPLTTPIKQASRFEHLFIKLVPYLIAVAATMLVLTLIKIAQTEETVQATAAYTRVSNCIVAKSANPEFTQEEIERCYVQVEKNSGVSLERFDFQTNKGNSPRE